MKHKNVVKDVQSFLDSKAGELIKQGLRVKFTDLSKWDDLDKLLNDLCKELGSSLAISAYIDGAQACELGDSLWKLFDFGKSVGICSEVKTIGIQKKMGGLVALLFRQRDELRTSLKNAHAEACHSQMLLLGIYNGEKKFVECPICEGTGFAEDEDTEELKKCWNCEGTKFDIVDVDTQK